jgi:transcriptional regulator with XRE-family HTH domain
MKKHWTETDLKDFAFAVSMDFVSNLETAMNEQGVSQRELAQRLGISEGRVSQVINNPGNLTLKSAIEWGHAVGRKVALLSYEAPSHYTGPVVPENFVACWSALGKPTDAHALAQAISEIGHELQAMPTPNSPGWRKVKGGFQFWTQEREQSDWKSTCGRRDCCLAEERAESDDGPCMVGGGVAP